MNTNSKRRHLLGGLIGAALAIGLGLTLDCFSFGHVLVNRSYDFLFAPRPNIPADEVRMVYMDEESYDRMKQPLNAPWDRALHAQLLERLKADHARAVAFDIVFSDPGPSVEADKRLARALNASGKVVLAVDNVPAGSGRAGVAGEHLTMPADVFRAAQVTFGTAEVDPDDDLILRRHLQGSPDDQFPGLSWATAEVAGAAVTQKEKPYDGQRWINYYGPPLTLPFVSYFRLFETNEIPAGYFSNKVVFVGARIFTRFAGERKDEYATPYSYWMRENRFISGVEAQATVFLNLLRGDWIGRLPFEPWWLVLLGAGFGYGLVQLRPLAAVGVTLTAGIVVAALAYYLFARQHVLFAWLIVVGAQLPAALLWSIVFNSVQLYVQNRLYEQSLRMYLPPKLVKKFASDKDLLKPGARKQLLTVLFTDIAGFTSLSEGMDSDELAHAMNGYFETAVSQCIHAEDGTIAKYLGDSIFAFWNAPDTQSDHAVRACEAALRFRELPPQHVRGRLLVTRLGLHTGEANVGNFGSAARVDYTAIGENINLASRMEGLNKYLGTRILMTAETRELIEDRLLTRFLGEFKLHGFGRTVQVYELVGRPNQAEVSRPRDEVFGEALQSFRTKDFPKAEAAFQRVLKLAPEDGPATFYLKFISELDGRKLPQDWSGAVEVSEK